VIYAATSPNKALSLLLQKNKAELAALNEKKTAVVDSLSSLTLQEKEPSNHGLRVITGGMNLVLKVIQMATEAKEDYVQILSKYGLRTLEEDGLLSAILSARKRGIPIRVITEIDSSNRKMADRLSRIVNVRTTRNLLFYLAIRDMKEMVFGPAFPVNEEERSSLDHRELDVWTDNTRFVEGMYGLFQKLWGICPKQTLINKPSH
jgi:sugar-specific transcriptional regulator TrmB